jgi:hemerythrin-like domain-containing protein
MEEALALIEKIIEEHKIITQRVRTLEQVANGLEAASALDRAGEGFMPGRSDDQRRGLQNLQESLETTDKGIQAHFNREETALLAAFEKHGGEMLASSLRFLLIEHEELRGRLTRSKKDVAQLTVGGSSREVWEGRAWGVRTYISHTRRLLEAHHRSEQQLLGRLRRELRRAQKQKN